MKFSPSKKLDVKSQLSVKVCYVQSAQEFYVQLQDSSSILNYDMLYYDLQKIMPNTPQLQKLKKDQCVGVLIESEWYRGRVVEVTNFGARVQIIDFGVIEDVPTKYIHLLPNTFVEIPSFAYFCCLNGFEANEISENITTQFEIFCSDSHGDRKLFKMLVTNNNYNNNGYLVELDDESVDPPASVNRILLKNSRPLAETITLENARKRQRENFKKEKDVKEDSREIKSPDRGRGSSQRGRGNYAGKALNRSPPQNSNMNHSQQRQRTHFKSVEQDEKIKQNSHGNNSSKNQKEITSWRGHSNDVKQQNSSNENQDRDHIREQKSNLNNGENAQNKNQNNVQKSNSLKTNNKNQADNEMIKQKSPSKQEKSPPNKQKTPVNEDMNDQATSNNNTNVEKKNKSASKDLKCGWISTLSSINEAYIHFEEHVKGLEKILDRMFNFYETFKSKTFNISQNNILL